MDIFTYNDITYVIFWKQIYTPGHDIGIIVQSSETDELKI